MSLIKVCDECEAELSDDRFQIELTAKKPHMFSTYIEHKRHYPGVHFCSYDCMNKHYNKFAEEIESNNEIHSHAITIDPTFGVDAPNKTTVKTDSVDCKCSCDVERIAEEMHKQVKNKLRSKGSCR